MWLDFRTKLIQFSVQAKVFMGVFALWRYSKAEWSVKEVLLLFISPAGLAFILHKVNKWGLPGIPQCSFIIWLPSAVSSKYCVECQWWLFTKCAVLRVNSICMSYVLLSIFSVTRKSFVHFRSKFFQIRCSPEHTVCQAITAHLFQGYDNYLFRPLP